MDYKQDIAEVFNRRASSYGRFGTHYFDIFADRLLSYCKVFPGASVLDVATGRGAILKRVIAPIGTEGKAVGIDLSSQMIEETKREIREKNISLYCMDAEQLGFEDHSFDIIYCGFALFFFPNLKKAMQEFRRVLKPEGKIAVSIWGKEAITERVLFEKLHSYGLDRAIFCHTLSSDEMTASFEAAGFTSIQIIQDTLDHLYVNFDHWWECLKQQNALEKLTEVQLHSMRDQLQRELEMVNRVDGFHEELEVVYAIASNSDEKGL